MLGDKLDSLEDENSKLKRQAEMIDSLENHSRRRNLLFHNALKKTPNETWEDCERAVQKVTKNAHCITTIVMIDRAHIGSAITVKLQNYKDEELILKNAYRLKNQQKRRRTASGNFSLVRIIECFISLFGSRFGLHRHENTNVIVVLSHDIAGILKKVVLQLPSPKLFDF